MDQCGFVKTRIGYILSTVRTSVAFKTETNRINWCAAWQWKENANERSRVVFTELYSALNRLKFSLIFRPYKKSYRVVITLARATIYPGHNPLLISDLVDPPSLFIHSSAEFLHREQARFYAGYVLVKLACRQSQVYVRNTCCGCGCKTVHCFLEFFQGNARDRFKGASRKRNIKQCWRTSANV